MRRQPALRPFEHVKPALLMILAREQKDERLRRHVEELRAAATNATEEEQVPVVVVRDGVEVTLYLRPGQMGIYGRDVEAK